MYLLLLAIAPIITIAFYIYYRDKYEKEPIGLLLLGLFAGGLTVIPISFIEEYLDKFTLSFYGNNQAIYRGFVVAAFTEELFKYLAALLIFWRNKNFNEKFDGIVYAVFVSLGFAAVENIMYVFNYGIGTGFIRAITAVPLHALCGVFMGYQLGLAKFIKVNSIQRLFYALAIPIIFHGFYDFLLMTEEIGYLIIFFPFVIYLWIRGFKRMKVLNKADFSSEMKKKISELA